MPLITKPVTAVAKALSEAHNLPLTILGIAATVALLYFGRILFITVLVAVTIAFILEPFVELLMRVRFPRSLASFVVCSVALAFVYIIGMGAYSQLTSLYNDLPKYGQRIGDIVDGVSQKVKGAEDRTLQMVTPAPKQPRKPPPRRPVIHGRSRRLRRRPARLCRKLPAPSPKSVSDPNPRPSVTSSRRISAPSTRPS